MRFYESTSTDPYENLALEEYFFRCMDRGEDYFILWQNDRAVIVGKYQNTLEEVNRRFADEHQIRVARRLSGGGAVYHDLNNLNYTFIVDEQKADAFCFEVFTRPVISVLRKLGVEASVVGRNDIAIGGKKISGSSQYFRDGRLLHHGCILLDCDVDTLSQVLQVKESKIQSKSIKSVRSRVTGINEHLKTPITMEQFKAALRDEVFAFNTPELVQLTKTDQQEIRKLRDVRYATWEWNEGESPRCDLCKERRFPFGTITLYLEMVGGRIEHARICGDFFGRLDIGVLERMLRGCRLVEEDILPFKEVELNAYIFGITWENWLDLICG